MPSSPTTRAGGEGLARPHSAALTMLGNVIHNLAQPQVPCDRETVLRNLREIERTLRAENAAPASAGADGGTQGAVKMREACLKVINDHKHTGAGTEDRNDLIGMYARGCRNTKRVIAKQIGNMPLPDPRPRTTDGGEA